MYWDENNVGSPNPPLGWVNMAETVSRIIHATGVDDNSRDKGAGALWFVYDARLSKNPPDYWSEATREEVRRRCDRLKRVANAIGRAFVRGTLRTGYRKKGGGPFVEMKPEDWGLDDFEPRISAGAFNADDPWSLNNAADQTAWLFVNQDDLVAVEKRCRVLRERWHWDGAEVNLWLEGIQGIEAAAALELQVEPIRGRSRRVPVQKADGTYEERIEVLDVDRWEWRPQEEMSGQSVAIEAPEALHLSPYLKLMLQVCRELKIDPGNQYTKDYIAAKLAEKWPEGAPVSDTLRGYMATAMREPASQLGKANKPLPYGSDPSTHGGSKPMADQTA